MDDTTEVLVENQLQQTRLQFKHKLAYGIGHILNDVCASIWFTYLLVYFEKVLLFSATNAGLVLLIGQVADALATPFVGLHSDIEDDFWLCRYGKRKTWHLIGTICVLGTFPFIFSQCFGCQASHQWAQLVYYAAFVCIFQFGWASVQISHLSLIPDLTPSKEDRTALTAIRYTFTVFSNVLVYAVAWAVLHITSSEESAKQINPKDAHKFQKIVLIGMAIGLLATVVFHIFVRETGAAGDARISGDRQVGSPWSLFKNWKLYQLALIYMPTRLFVNLAQCYVPFYLQDTLHMPVTALAIVPLMMYLSSFKASLTIQYVNKRVGRRASYALGALMGLGACTWMYFGAKDTIERLFIYPISMLLGAGGSMMLVTSLAITADFIGAATENGAFVYGIMSFSDKLSNGLAVMLIQWMRCTDACYEDILVFACGGAALLGLATTLSITEAARGGSTAGQRR